jgi:hypothetical protein
LPCKLQVQFLPVPVSDDPAAFSIISHNGGGAGFLFNTTTTTDTSMCHETTTAPTITVCKHVQQYQLFFEDGIVINHSLDAVITAIVNSLNKLADGAVDDHFFYIISVKGDWMFLRETMHMVRSWASEQVCWQCLATKGTNDLSMSLSNCAPDAPRQQTTGQCSCWPPNWLPAFMSLAGFVLSMLAIDMLHCWHIGHGRDMNGSVIVTLIKDGFFPGVTIGARLRSAFGSLKAFATQHRKPVTCIAIILRTSSDSLWLALLFDVHLMHYIKCQFVLNSIALNGIGCLCFDFCIVVCICWFFWL